MFEQAYKAGILRRKSISDLLRGLNARLDLAHDRIRDDWRSLQDLGISRTLSFRMARLSREHKAVFTKRNPLVSICIPTYNKGSLLVERALKSCLSQTHQNLEIIVVGDHCTDNTVKLMKEVTDRRVIFENLPQRGNYPEDPELRWMVAGCAPFNRMLELATGDFITHLDHDDEYVPDRIEKLVRFAQAERADLVYHPFLAEYEPDEWRVNPATWYGLGFVTSSAMFYHRTYAVLEGDIHCHRYREPGDWNRARKLRFAGPAIRRYPEPLTKHFRERTSLSESGTAVGAAIQPIE